MLPYFLQADCSGVTLLPLFLDKHRHVAFWSWTPQRRALQTGEKQRPEQPEYLLESALAQTGFLVCHPIKENTPTSTQSTCN